MEKEKKAKTSKMTLMALEQRVLLDASFPVIANTIFHFDALDVDGDGLTNDQPADGALIDRWDDDSGNNYDAASSGGNRPRFDAAGFEGRGAINFDGTSDYLDIANATEINTGSYSEKSFAMVFETGADISGTQMLYEQGGGSNGYNIIMVGGDLYVYTWGESYWAAADRYKSVNLGAVTANTVYYVTAVHDATDADINNRTFSVSLNGGPAQVLTRVDTLGSHSGNVTIGHSNDSQTPVGDANLGSGSHFQGNIGEFWSWNHALTAQEVSDINDYIVDKWLKGPPQVETGIGVLGQGGSLVLTTDVLTATDINDPDSGLLYELTALTSNGTLFLSGAALSVGDSFTQQDVLDGKISYTHGAGANSTDSFSFTVSDAENVTGPHTVNLEITPALDVLTATSADEAAVTAITNTELSYDAAWYDNSWTYRQKIVVDHDLVDADLDDFALFLTESGFGADFWGNVKVDGSDIVVTGADGLTKLDRELVAFNTATQSMQLYTRGDLKAGTDTVFYIYYGNAGAAETNQTTTWRGEYGGVWHFESDFDVQISDSSQAAHNGFGRNGFDSNNQIAGAFGSGAEFNNSEYIALDYGLSGNNSLQQISVSAWVNTTVNVSNYNDNWSLIDFDRSEFFNVYIHGDGRVAFSTSGNGLGIDDFYSTGVKVNDGNWHHIAAVYDGTDKILYVDGMEVARDINAHGGTGLGNGTRYAFIGDGSEATGFDGGRNNLYYDGLYDNLRVYEGTTSGAWVAAEYRNHFSPNMFYQTETQIVYGGHIIYTVTDAPDTGTLFVDANSNSTLDAGEARGLGGMFTQTDIDAGRLLYVHDGSEVTSDSFAFTVSDTSGYTSIVNTKPLVINPVNDFPTAVMLSGTDVPELTAIGGDIATLSATDADLPGDSFTYSIQNDPDGKFTIAGNMLRLMDAVDFETKDNHNVTIRVSDGNGGFFDQAFVMNVLDEIEFNGFIPPDEGTADGTPGSRRGFDTAAGGESGRYFGILDYLQNNLRPDIFGGENELIRQATDSSRDGFLQAFYGADGLSQQIRDNINGPDAPPDSQNVLPDQATAQDSPLQRRETGDVAVQAEHDNAPRNPFPDNLMNNRLFQALYGSQPQQEPVQEISAAGQLQEQIAYMRNTTQQLSDIADYYKKQSDVLKDALLQEAEGG